MPLVAALTVALCGAVSADEASSGAGLFREWNAPAWASPLEDAVVRVSVEPGAYSGVRLVYRTPAGIEKSVPLDDPDASGTPAWSFTLPASEFARPGTLTYRVVALTANALQEIQSEERILPVGYAEELDVTGEAAEVLLYPLPDDEYVARYVPCCNIYGGYTYAARVPVNPANTAEGLPAEIASPFIVLEPDGMSASTMGLYLDLHYDPAAIPSGKRIALFEFNLRNTWSEVLSYDIRPEESLITLHCPEGGTYVLGLVSR